LRIIVQNTIQILTKPNLLGFFKAVFIGIVACILIYQIIKLDLTLSHLREIFQKINIPFLLLGILLVLPNYYLEILKWKILGQQLETRSFKESTVEVLRGLKLGIVTPLMIGDYVGRSIGFKKENKGGALMLNLFNSFTQTWTSLVFGAAALSIWWFSEDESIRAYIFFPATAIACAAIIGLALLYGIRFSSIPKWKIIQPYIQNFDLPLSIKNKIIGLSILRTLVYNLQYICFYKAFSIILGPTIYFVGVNILLLIKTVGGGLNILGDLTLRELVSINFFGLYGIDQRLVLIATFVVWFFNVFTPVVFGIFYSPRK
jgi:uncharacterized membrane protein YbhN (UPF0104 family)